MSDLELKLSYLSYPGETIQEHSNAIGMTQVELAKLLNCSVENLDKLINGEIHITNDIALNLESVFDIPSSFWLNLEDNYQKELIEIQRMKSYIK